MRGFSRYLTRRVAVLAVVALALAGLSVLSAPTASPARAASGAGFNAGMIISDADFYNPSTMSTADIQAFLDAKEPRCASGYTCLKSYYQTSTSKAARTGCSAYTGRYQSAADMISSVAQACRVNPQVLLVLLEKEQALVSDTTPSSYQYRSATGFACPDTAACDAQYYGFFNQLYSAALQYRVYQAYPNSFRYRAGQWNTIQWSPNAACGSSQVYISNQATAGLYDYTPYRPNQAALNNMYGLGDSCSAYGNRNFYRIFTDWFGSTQAVTGDFIRTSSDPSLYLVVGSQKHSVPSLGVYTALSALGTARIVSQSVLDGYPTAASPASTVVRDPVSGDISLVQAGTRHRFASCDLVALFGSSCSSALDLTPAQLAKLPVGAAMSSYWVAPGSSAVYTRIGQDTYRLYDWNALLATTGGTVPFIATMDAATAASRPAKQTLLAPLSLVKSASSPTVYLVDGTSSRIPVPSFALASEYGAKGYTTVPDSVLAPYTVSSQALSVAGRCPTGTVVVGQGVLHRWTNPGDAGGIPTTTLSADTCSRLPSAGAVDGRLFVRGVTSPDVYLVAAGKKKAVATWSSLLALAGGTAPTIVTLSDADVAALPDSPLVSGAVVRTKTDSRVWVVDGANRILVGSLATTAELGLPSYTWASSSALGALTAQQSLLTRQVSCSWGTGFAVGGTLYRLSSPASTGVATTSAGSGLCSALTVSPSAPRSSVFVKTATDPRIYLVSHGQLRPVSDPSRFAALGGSYAQILSTAAASGLADLPLGPDA